MSQGNTQHFLIGASAGGLEALEHFFKHMPSARQGLRCRPASGARSRERAAAGCSRYTRMPVEHVRDNTKVAPDRVYIIRPTPRLIIKDGMLELAAPAEPRGQRTRIDSFLAPFRMTAAKMP